MRRVWFVIASAACGRVGFDAPPNDGQLTDDQVAAITCPSGFVPVAPVADYVPRAFCVAKYEMKNVGGVATSVTADQPWTNISRNGAITACQALGAGYDLIGDAQWQAIARQAADEPSNWSSGTAYVGMLSVGHSDSSPFSALSASTDDDPCAGTNQTCSQTVWDVQRRTHRLPNGSVLWDLGGNSVEWAKDDNSTIQGSDEYVALLASTDIRVSVLGSVTRCDNVNTPQHCGYGMIHSNSIGGTFLRGGGLDWGVDAGIFTGSLFFVPNKPDWNISFRCVYAP